MHQKDPKLEGQLRDRDLLVGLGEVQAAALPRRAAPERGVDLVFGAGSVFPSVLELSPLGQEGSYEGTDITEVIKIVQRREV